MLKIGITGGIGTGKSFVGTIFKKLGVPVYDADQAAKEIVESNKKLKADILLAFGPDAYTVEGKYNRNYIRKLIFQDENAKVLLNGLIHPEVLKDSQRWFESMETAHHPYVLKEAAILFESKSDIGLDKIIVVDAPVELRLDRITKRDHISTEEALLKINAQLLQEEKVKLADYVILNDGQHPVIPQVLQLHHLFIQLSQVHKPGIDLTSKSDPEPEDHT